MKLVARLGLTELSVQVRLTCAVLTAVPARLLGAAGGAGVVTVAVLDGAESPVEEEAVT